MEKKTMFQNITIIVLGVALIVMSVGYANFSQDLKINGDVEVKTAKWDVHFANIANKNAVGATVNGSGPTISDSNHTVSFDVTLNKPGDSYTFDVDVVNDGTFDAKLNTMTSSGYYNTWDNDTSAYTTTDTSITTNNFPNNGVVYENSYLKYTVMYSDSTYLTQNDPLARKGATGDKKTLTIKVEYLGDDDHPENLPTTDTKYHFEITLGYLQV